MLPESDQLRPAHGAPGSLSSVSRRLPARIVTMPWAYVLIAPLFEKLRANGESMKAIADKLNEEGRKTRTGSNWTAMLVKRVLDRSFGTNCSDKVVRFRQAVSHFPFSKVNGRVSPSL